MRILILFTLLFAVMTHNAFAAQITLSAKLTEDGDRIEKGMKWRIFTANQESEENLNQIEYAQGGTVQIELEAGVYLIHAGFGKIEDIRQVSIANTNIEEEFILQAGGIKLNARSGDNDINEDDLSFDIFDKEIGENGQRQIIAQGIKANETIRLKEGVYHIVSKYGDINASASADLEIKAGKITDAIMQQRGAKISMKLVSQEGGGAIANTAWVILTEQGHEVFNSTLVEPQLILAEGKYEASVTNRSKTYIQQFDVKTGEDQSLELLIDY